MLKRKLIATLSLLLLNFISCTVKDRYSSANDEQVEPQPVIVSGKNVFTVYNGSVQCSYLPKSATEYTLFCHAYIKTTSLETQSSVSHSLTFLIGDETDTLEIATELAPGVSLDWAPLQITSETNPLVKQTCTVTDKGLGYICEMEFTPEAFVSIESLKVEVNATARDDKGVVATQKVATDVLDKNAVAQTVLVERLGKSVNDYVSFEIVELQRNVIKDRASTVATTSLDDDTSPDTTVFDLSNITMNCSHTKDGAVYTVDCVLMYQGMKLEEMNEFSDLTIVWQHAYSNSSNDVFNCSPPSNNNTESRCYILTVDTTAIRNQLEAKFTAEVKPSNGDAVYPTMTSKIALYDNTVITSNNLSQVRLVCDNPERQGVVWINECKLKLLVDGVMVAVTGFGTTADLAAQDSGTFVLSSNDPMSTEHFYCSFIDTAVMRCTLKLDTSRFNNQNPVSGKYVAHLVRKNIDGSILQAPPILSQGSAFVFHL